MAYAWDLKSQARKGLRVRSPSPASFCTEETKMLSIMSREPLSERLCN